MLPIDEILEALDLSRAEPGRGFLEALWARFHARVPFETASQILRDVDARDLEDRLGLPPIFWRDHIETGSGGAGFCTTAALNALLEDLGFSTRKVLCRVGRDFDHAAILVQQGSDRWICDVEFPLPALLPAREGTVDTPLGELSVERTASGYRVDRLSGVPEGPGSLEIFEAEVSEQQFRDSWKESLVGARDSRTVILRRQEAFRAVSFSRGEVCVDDRHSRLTVALPLPLGERLQELFGIDRKLLDRAFALTGGAEPAKSGSRLAAYLEVSSPPQTAFESIGSLPGYDRLIAGIATVSSRETTPNGWRIELEPPDGAPESAGVRLVEEVSLDCAGRRLRVERRSSLPSEREGPPASLSEFRVEERGGRTHLVREALWPSSREDLLRNDSLRGRLAASLAVDLLAWGRLLARTDPITI